MNGPEKKAYATICREMGHKWHCQRHEDRYSPDIPDISFSYEGYHGWIELKAGEHDEPLKLRPGQLNWLIKRGGHGFLVVRVTSDGRHVGWVGVRNDELRLVRALRRPTPDTLLASLPTPATGTSFEETLRSLLKK